MRPFRRAGPPRKSNFAVWAGALRSPLALGQVFGGNGAVLRARPCTMAVAAGCFMIGQPGGRARRVGPTSRRGRLPRVGRVNRPGALCGPRSTARRAAPAPGSGGGFLWRASTICYHVHDGSYCDIGGVNELPSRQTSSVGRGGGHRPDCARRGVRLTGRRDATSTVKHYSVLPGRLHPA